MTFIAFNSLTKQLGELFKRKDHTNPQWTISPDGAHIGELREDTIVVLSLGGQIEQTIHVAGWPNLRSLDWTADGNAFLAASVGSTKATLLRIGRDGGIQPIWEMRNLVWTWAIPSPDGQYLAIRGASMNSNAWLIENF